jgi:translation initiation factor IF-2
MASLQTVSVMVKAPVRGGFAARIRKEAALPSAAEAADAAGAIGGGAVAGEGGDEGAAEPTTAARGRSRESTAEFHLKRQQSVSQNKKKQSAARRAAKDRFLDKEKVMLMPAQPTAKSLASAMQCRTVDVLKTMIRMGEQPISGDEPLVVELAQMIGEDSGFEVRFEAAPTAQLLQPRARPAPEAYRLLPRRPPVVAIVGHIDHGKTTLLDRFRRSSLAAAEAGGITQAIGSFSLSLAGGESVTFIDTPGHMAFQLMRERGVDVTDVALLVVALDAGIQEQTLQALATLRQYDAKFIVVVNKCDIEYGKADRLVAEFTKHGVNAESLGGDVPFAFVSAKTGLGMDELEQQLLVCAEELDLRADHERGSAEAVVLEAHQDTGVGVRASIVVRRGTLAVGDVFVCGTTTGRVRSLLDDKGQTVSQALPGRAVELFGFRDLPSASDQVFVVADERAARRFAEARMHVRQYEDMQARHKEAALLAAERRRERVAFLQSEIGLLNARRIHTSNLDELSTSLMNTLHLRTQSLYGTPGDADAEYPKPLVLLCKAKTAGALEALTLLVQSMPQDDDVTISIAQSGVGDVNDGDVDSAAAIGATIVLYGVPEPTARVRQLLTQHSIDVLSSPIIYQLLDKIKALGSKLLRPVEKVTFVGRARILKLFVIDANSSRATTIAGCRVVSGVVKQGAHVRVVKAAEVQGADSAPTLNSVVSQATLLEHQNRLGRIRTLRHLKDTVKEVKKDTECGIDLQNVGDFAEGDFIDCYAVEMTKRAWGEPPAPPPIFSARPKTD